MAKKKIKWGVVLWATDDPDWGRCRIGDGWTSPDAKLLAIFDSKAAASRLYRLLTDRAEAEDDDRTAVPVFGVWELDAGATSDIVGGQNYNSGWRGQLRDYSDPRGYFSPADDLPDGFDLEDYEENNNEVEVEESPKTNK